VKATRNELRIKPQNVAIVVVIVPENVRRETQVDDPLVNKSV
jgi:hypothetical protein